MNALPKQEICDDDGGERERKKHSLTYCPVFTAFLTRKKKKRNEGITFTFIQKKVVKIVYNRHNGKLLQRNFDEFDLFCFKGI